MPRVAYSPDEIEPVLLGQQSYKNALLRLRLEIQQIEQDFEEKEILTILKQNIDRVILQFDRTKEYLWDRRQGCQTTRL